MERKIIKAIILTLSLFIAILGIWGSSYAKTSKSRFIPHTIVEIQEIEAEVSVIKIGQGIAEFYYPFSLFAPAAFYLTSFRPEARQTSHGSTTLIPARAPPSIN